MNHETRAIADTGGLFQLAPFRRTFVSSIAQPEAYARLLALHQREVVLPHTSVFLLSNYRYRFQAEDQRVVVRGPYGTKAWTLKTTVVLHPQEPGCAVIMQSVPAGRVIANLVSVLVVLIVGSLFIGIPGAPFFPLVFFAPFMLLGMLVGLHIEGNRVAGLIERIVLDHAIQVG